MGEHEDPPDNPARALDTVDVAEYELVGISRWLGEIWAHKSERINASGAGRFAKGTIANSDRPSAASSQVNWWTRRSEFGRHPHQVGEGIRFHFLHDLPAVRLHRNFADPELTADLFIEQPRDD